MAATSHHRGHVIEYVPDNTWAYVDSCEPIDDDRPCVRCGKAPTAEGFDRCKGFVPGARSVCCGHGVGPSIIVYPQRTPLTSEDSP